MSSKLFSLTLVTLLVCGCIAQTFISAVPVAADSGSYFWDEPVKIKQPAKPKAGRVRTAARPKADSKGEELAPLLTLKYNLLQRASGGDGRPVDAAQTAFDVGNQFRLALTPNQHGYLYVIHHSVDNNNNIVDQPHIIFPSPRINNGRNEVKKDEQYVVPKFCPEFDDPKVGQASHIGGSSRTVASIRCRLSPTARMIPPSRGILRPDTRKLPAA